MPQEERSQKESKEQEQLFTDNDFESLASAFATVRVRVVNDNPQDKETLMGIIRVESDFIAKMNKANELYANQKPDAQSDKK